MADTVTATTSIRNAIASSGTDRPWAADFYREWETSGLPLATLNSIVRAAETHDAARAAVAQRLAAGEGASALQEAARADIAQRIGAAHSKAHQPNRTPKRQ